MPRKTAHVWRRDAAGKPVRSADRARVPGAPPGSAPRAAARCERGGAQRSRLDPVRLNSATRRYTAFLCCDLAALSPAAAARLYISSVLPLKSVIGVARAKLSTGRL